MPIIKEIYSNYILEECEQIKPVLWALWITLSPRQIFKISCVLELNLSKETGISANFICYLGIMGVLVCVPS